MLREEAPGARGAVLAAFEAAGVPAERVRVVAELGSTEAVLTAVAAGLGIGFVSAYALVGDRVHHALGVPRVRDLAPGRDLLLVSDRATRSARSGRRSASSCCPRRRGPGRRRWARAAGPVGLDLAPLRSNLESGHGLGAAAWISAASSSASSTPPVPAASPAPIRVPPPEPQPSHRERSHDRSRLGKR